MLPCALTFDDAPGPADGAALDAIRKVLLRYGIRDCTAFVVSDHIAGEPAALQRWLADGFALGNHTADHEHVSKLGIAAFVASVERCDRALRAFGALTHDKPRYFRHPFGDRGNTPAQRTEVHAALARAGYTLADVSIDTHDYCYETPLQRARLSGNSARTHAIERRMSQQVYASFARCDQALVLRDSEQAQALALDFPHVAAFHVLDITARTLDRVLSALSDRVCWVSLQSALAHPAYRFVPEHPRHNGIVGSLLEPASASSLGRRLAPARHAARAARVLGMFGQRKLGPRWPHLAD